MFRSLTMENNVDIVIPIYNSRVFLDHLIDRLTLFSKQTAFSLHVYFVDDGSLDDSYDFLATIQLPFDFTTIRLSRNHGQHTASAIGLSYCKSIYCVTIDDDLQHDPLDIPLLIDEMNRSNADLVFAKYDEKQHSVLRNIGSWLIKKAIYIDKAEYNDVTSFRLMKLAIAKQFSLNRSPVGFLDQALLSSTRKISTVVVKHRSSKDLKSRYSIYKLIRFAFRIILFHSSLPLRFIIRLGLFSASLFFIIGCYFLYNRFVNEVPLGFSAIIVSLFFSSGLILVVLGIIAEYLRKIWVFQQGFENVIIDEICQRTKSPEFN